MTALAEGTVLDSCEEMAALETIRRGVAISPELKDGVGGTLALAAVASAGAFEQITRPDQMVTAALIACMTPRYAEAGDHRAGIDLVEMRAQHDRRDSRLTTNRGGQVERRDRVLAASGEPPFPIRDLLLQHIFKNHTSKIQTIPIYVLISR